LFTKKEIEVALKEAWNMTELAKNLGYNNPGTNTKRRIKRLMDEMKIDYSHLKKTARPKYKYKTIFKKCPVCKKSFKTKLGSKKEKSTCSYACSNSYFRSKENHPNFKSGKRAYRKIVFDQKEPRCERCGWNKVKEVLHCHHIDRNRDNNETSNLEILCPTCHELEHYLSGDGKFWKLSD
jgi:hypothetical protein